MMHALCSLRLYQRAAGDKSGVHAAQTARVIRNCIKQMLETYLGKPGLVRETSRITAFGLAAQHLRATAQRMRGRRRLHENIDYRMRSTSSREAAEKAFEDVVLSPDLKEQVKIGAT